MCECSLTQTTIVIRDNDTELPAATKILLQSTRRSQRVELLAAATERVNPVVSARTKTQELALLAQIRPAAERLPSRRAAPGKISGIVARLRRLVQRPLPVATARHTVSRRWFPVAVAVVAASQRAARQ